MFYSDGSGKGTCTCTCETKPVSASSSSSSESSGIVHPVKTVENYVPETASLMRTATGSRQGSTAGKTAEQQQDHDSKQYEVGDSGIVHVPPMKDYGLNAYESNFAEPSQQQQQQQVENAQQQQQYVQHLHDVLLKSSSVYLYDVYLQCTIA